MCAEDAQIHEMTPQIKGVCVTEGGGGGGVRVIFSPVTHVYKIFF